MPKTPFTDIWQFLAGTTPDHLSLGGWRYLFVTLFWLLLVGSVAIAIANWRQDPAQRTGTHLGLWGVRVLIGCMWFEGMLWKLPLPLSEGLSYWTTQMATRAAFDVHREFVSSFLIPNMHFFGPLVFLAELTFAVSLILGVGVRLVGMLGFLFVLNLWLGIYRPGEPAEWPWSYMFLAMLMFLFSVLTVGRSLGLDAWLWRNVPAVRDGKGFVWALLNRIG